MACRWQSRNSHIPLPSSSSSSSSSSSQVLLSIQGMILIPDPVFNEPGYETIRGTPQGDVSAASRAGAARPCTLLASPLRHRAETTMQTFRCTPFATPCCSS